MYSFQFTFPALRLLKLFAVKHAPRFSSCHGVSLTHERLRPLFWEVLLVIRKHLSTLLVLTVLSMLGLGQSSWALQLPPEKEPPAKKKVEGEDTKKGKDEPAAKMEDPKEPPKKEDGKDGKKDPPAPPPTLAEVATLAQKGVDDAKAAAEKATADSAAATVEGKKRGDTAWMMVASALVLLMVPGLALFYGGMVRKKNVLATMMQSYAAMAIVGLFWIAFGYGLAFGPSVIKLSILGVEDGGIVGWSSDLFFLRGINSDAFLPAYNIPVYTHVMFQGMFAIITPALISGAIAERIRFWPFCIFMITWVTFVYCPLAHMVWAWDWFYPVPVDALKGIGGVPIGLLGKMGALDFAGGTVVHIAAGTAGLACAFVLPKRLGYPGHTIQPNSMVLTLIGAGLLWVGWFGFNGGSSLTADALGSSAFAATQAAAAAAGFSWILVEWMLKGKPTALGLASGIVAGLVAVTPASGFVPMWAGAVIGLIAGVVCYFSVQMKTICGYDDSLDAFGVHAVGGFLGAVLTGVFCYTAINAAGADGLFAYREHVSKLSALKEKYPDKETIDTIAGLEASKVGKSDDEKKKIDEEIEKATKDWKKSPASKHMDEINAEIEKKTPGVSKAKDEYFVGAKPDEATGGAAAKYNDAVTAAFTEATKKEKNEAKIKETAEALKEAKKVRDEKEKEYQKLAGEVGVLEKEKKDLLDEIANLGKQEGISKSFFEKEKGQLTQFWIQVKAALFSMIFAFVLSLILAFIVQAATMGNFSTDKKSEVEGLDLTEHGEVGFDLATGYDSMPVGSGAEPRAAKAPPGQKRFAVVIEGVENGGLIKAWSELCQPSADPIDPDFKAVYPYVTTIQGNRFQLRGGDPATVSSHLQKLFSKKLGKQLKVRVEE